MDIDIYSINMNGYSLEIAGYNEANATYYFGNDLEYRVKGSDDVEIIENVSGGDIISRRVHQNDFDHNASDEYFIKNHLGSTVALVTAEGDVVGQVIDYYAYGKQKVVGEDPTSRVTQSFTGKEFDLFDKEAVEGEDGEGWYYFGARYYDADVGLWAAVDPKRQFHSAYSYTGNGVNPIKSIDPNGEDVYILNAPDGASGFGHNAILVGNEKNGYYYWSREGNKSSGISGFYDSFEEFRNSYDPKSMPNQKIKFRDRYSRMFRIHTSENQDILMNDYAFENYDEDYDLFFENCGDLVGETIEAAELNYDTKSAGDMITVPNTQYNKIKRGNVGVEENNE